MAKRRAALVVDGDRTFRHFALRVAQRLGCTAIGLRDAEEALSWMDRAIEPPAVITIDPKLRSLSGFVLCEHIRCHPMMCAAPVLFASSCSAVEDNMRAFDVGGDELFVKPVRPDLYVDAVTRALAGRRRPRAVAVEVTIELALPSR